MTIQARKRYAASLLVLMVFLSFLNLLGATLLNDMIDHYALEDAAKGYNSTARSVGGIITLFASFLIMGRVRKKVLLIFAAAAGILSMIIMKAADQSFAFYLGGWVLVGVSASFLDTLLSASMAELYQGKEAEKMMGLLHTTFSLSAVIVPGLYGIVLRWLKGAGLSWNYLFLLVAGLGVAALVLYLLSMPRKQSNPSADDTVPPAREAKLTPALIKKRLTSGMLPGLILAMVFHDLFFGGFSTWISRYVSVTLESTLGDLVLSLMWLGVMLSRIAVPRMPFTPKQYLRVGGFVTGALVLAGVAFADPVIMCIATFLVGTVFGGMLTAMINLSCTATPENPLLGTTSMSLAMFAAALVASPLIGLLESTFGLSIGMAVLAVPVILVSVVMIFVLRPGKGEQQPD